MMTSKATSTLRLRRHTRLVRLAVLLVCMGCFTPAIAAEVEPNDTFSSASPTPFSLFFNGIVTQLTLGNGEQGDLDVDMYTLVVPSDWPLPVSLSALAVSNPPVDLMLRLFDSAGTEIATNDDGNEFQPDVPAIYTFLLSHGTYYIGVSSAENPLYDPSQSGSGRAGPGGAYDLYVSGGSENLPVSPYEPNDRSGNATAMGFGSFAVSGEWIGDNSYGRLDVDIYHLSLLAPARLDIHAHSVDGLFDPVVRVRSCEEPIPTPTTMDRCSLGSADDQPDGSADALLSTAMFEPGDVYIMVSGSGNRAFNPAIAGSGEPGSVGEYDLVVTVTPLGPGVPDEPNDSILMATQTPLLIEGRPNSFSIDAFLGDGPYALLRGDRDFYGIRVLESHLLSITIEAGSLGSDLIPLLVAYDHRGRMLAYADASSVGDDATLMLPAGCIVPVPGSEPSLILMVMGIKQRLPNNLFDPFYWYNAELVAEHLVDDGPGSTGAYRLTVSVLESDAGCAIEPNDSMSTATETNLVNEGFYFCADAFWGDSLCSQPQKDVDMWAFKVTHPPVQLRVEVSDCDSFDPFNLFLLDDAGNELAFVYGYASIEPNGTSILLTAELHEAQKYTLLATSEDFLYGIHTPCSCTCWSAEASYDISITLSPLRSMARSAVSARGAKSDDNNSIFATRLDPTSPGIDVYESVSGSVVSQLASPEPQLGGTGGLASNGQNLFFLGAGRFPRLYKMDATTGDVLEQFFMWIGSGYYSDATMLGEEMYLLDHRRRQVHVVDPVAPRYIRSLSLGFMHDITIGGGMAALAGPNRLYVADAFNTESIYEIHPTTGSWTGTIPAISNRPTSLAGLDSKLFVADFRTQTLEARNRNRVAIGEMPLVAPVGMLAGFSSPNPIYDFDEDGDVDLLDIKAFQDCFRQSNESVPCEIADWNEDDIVDLMDAIYLSSFMTGP